MEGALAASPATVATAARRPVDGASLSAGEAAVTPGDIAAQAMRRALQDLLDEAYWSVRAAQAHSRAAGRRLSLVPTPAPSHHVRARGGETTRPRTPRRHELFLPYAYREHPPLDRCVFCQALEHHLQDFGVRTELNVREGRRTGIVVTCSEQVSPFEFWQAVEAFTPDGAFGPASARMVLGEPAT